MWAFGVEDFGFEVFGWGVGLNLIQKLCLAGWAGERVVP